MMLACNKQAEIPERRERQEENLFTSIAISIIIIGIIEVLLAAVPYHSAEYHA